MLPAACFFAKVFVFLVEYGFDILVYIGAYGNSIYTGLMMLLLSSISSLTNPILFLMSCLIIT